MIVDEGTVLFESCIINEYLDEKYPTAPLMPKEPAQRGKARVLIDYGLNYIHPQYWTIRGEFIKPAAERNAMVIEQTREKLRDLLQYLERAIGDNRYFVGDFSLADVALVPRFLKMESFGVLPTSSLPRLSAWLQRMIDRPFRSRLFSTPA